METMELETESQMADTLVVERLDVGAPSDVAIRLIADQSEDWYEAALTVHIPIPRPIRNSWGEDEEVEDEVPEDDEEADDEDPDPFEDFDEDDFDDEFDDDFEEELEDEYEIEPADDGMLEGHPDAENIDDDEELVEGVEPPAEFPEEE